MRANITTRALSGAAIALIVSIIAAGCASSAAPAQAPTAAPTQAPAAAPTQVLGATPPPAATSGGEPTSSGQRVSGTVQSVSGQTITLTDGKTLTLTPDTMIIRVQPTAASDLKPRDYVAITAKRQPDGTLLASTVNIFAESQRGVGAGQRPMAGGNLMTNATIETVNGNTFTASFPGGNATVQLAPNAKIQRFVQGTPADIKSGVTLSAFEANGAVRAITLQ